MTIEELNEKLEAYITGENNRYWVKSQYWEEKRKLCYENDYLKLVEITSSNKWIDKEHKQLSKMWSIIYRPKKPFMMLENYKTFQKVYNVNITPVKKGINVGCMAIRLYDTKIDPDKFIVKDILDYIFQNN